MRIIDLNKTREIGSQCMYLEAGSFKILLDCGMSPREEGYKALPNFSPIDGKAIDIIIISHCHLDHIGSLPFFMKNQQQARILTSPGSHIIMPRILENSVTIMAMQREERGIKEYPLYSVSDIKNLDQHILPMSHAKTRTLQKGGDEINITFFSAGHVIGASSVLIEHKHRTLFFSGDVLFRNQKTLKGAMWPKKKVDVAISETTRGNHGHRKNFSYQSEIDSLVSRIKNTIEGGGSALVPAFALGRMQEILKILHGARAQNKLPKNVPIFCSGLGLGLVDDFDIASKSLRCIDFRSAILRDLKVKSFRNAKFDKLRQPTQPSIFVLSSGMLVENTPSYTTAANLVGDAKNSILFVGYCDPSTPGGELLAQEKHSLFNFKALRLSCKIEANIEHFDLSGHADREDLIEYIFGLNPRTIILTHGEVESRDWFFDSIIDQRPKTVILDPEPGVWYDV
ncbi:MAG: MBL fold metallo-hydrolase [Puniceicoccales bacterium]|jgi:Cft2 family RNA processing exonuclease|nr:MBL fold metallo-hydrolase [Puniceicoccales bacterium]